VFTEFLWGNLKERDHLKDPGLLTVETVVVLHLCPTAAGYPYTEPVSRASDWLARAAPVLGVTRRTQRARNAAQIGRPEHRLIL
jgi:hypothetical protein